MINELTSVAEELKQFFKTETFSKQVKPDFLNKALWLYPNYGGKAMRPALLKWSAAMLDEKNAQTLAQKALPVASAVELFHIWTLVHDDIIDQDDVRRGGPSVHRFIESETGADARFSENMAILTGDIQQAWSNHLIINSELEDELKLAILNRLNSHVNPLLISGEAIDVEFEIRHFADITYDEILEMLRLKTALLLRFSAEAGAMIGLNTTNIEDPRIQALAEFAECAGLAFQLKDDLLGTYADEDKLGKPTGSDLRQGKVTCLFAKARSMMSKSDLSFFDSVHGNQKASDDDCEKVAQLMVDCGARQQITDQADAYIRKSLDLLKSFPDNKYRQLLQDWALYIATRNK